MIEFSILVPTVPGRVSTMFWRLLKQLEHQAFGLPVEIIGLYDNKKMSVGAKRNNLLRMVSGKYFAFIDDDDRIESTYVVDILNAIRENPGVDVITFDIASYINGVLRHNCHYSLQFDYRETETEWFGKPAHTHVWRTGLVGDIDFPKKNFGEDFEWVKLACTRAHTEAHIPKTLYHYFWDQRITETRGKENLLAGIEHLKED